MIEINTKTFTEGGLARKANYSEQYQLTKLAKDMYQIYNFADKNAEICNAKDTLKRLASIRGGRSLDKSLSKHVLDMEDFSTITITASAISLQKTASTEQENEEPWKIVAVNGAEYFISTKEPEDQEEPVKKATASSNVKHVYTVKIQAHNISEIAKIASFAEEKLHAIANTTQIPTQDSIIVDVATEQTPEDAKASIQKEVEGNGIYLQDDAYQVFNDSCPCGCGKKIEVQPQTMQQPIKKEIPEGSFILITPESPKQSVASSVDTLKKYADSHYETYSIVDSTGNSVFAKEADNTTFADALSALATVADEVLAKTATDAVIIKQDGTVGAPGSAIQPGDQVVDPDKNSVITVQDKASEESELKTKAADEPTPVFDEKNPEDTNAKGDDDVKKWKGLREDQSGKFVVYITETEEHIFDNLEAAVDYLTKK